MTGKASPYDRAPQGMVPPRAVPRGPTRGRSLVHGLPVQVAYATIDACFVIISGVSILWLRFGLTQPLGSPYKLFATVFGLTHLSFFLLYSALVVLCCAEPNTLQYAP